MSTGYGSANQMLAAFKSQASQGVDIFADGDPAAGEYGLFSELEIVPSFEPVEPEVATASIDGECHGVIYSHNEVTWRMPLIGQSAVDQPPPNIDAMLMAANFKRTINAGVDVTYHPVFHNDFTDTPEMTAVKYIRNLNDATEAKRLIARGVKTNFDLAIEAKRPAYFSGTGQGLYDPEPATWGSMPTLPTQYALDLKAFYASKIQLTINDGSDRVFNIDKMNIATNWSLNQMLGGDPVSGKKGAVRRIVCEKAKSGQRFGGSMDISGGTVETQTVVNAALAGTVVTLEAILTNGTHNFKATGSIQFGAFTRALPKYTVPYFFVRPQGNAGEQGGSLKLHWYQS